MVVVHHLSECPRNKNDKIPAYAKDYKKEYLFIRGINKIVKSLINLECEEGKKFNSRLADRIKSFIERFEQRQQKGKLEDITEITFKETDIENLTELLFEMENYEVDEEDEEKFFEFYIAFEGFYDKIKCEDNIIDKDKYEVYTDFEEFCKDIM